MAPQTAEMPKNPPGGSKLSITLYGCPAFGFATGIVIIEFIVITFNMHMTVATYNDAHSVLIYTHPLQCL